MARPRDATDNGGATSFRKGTRAGGISMCLLSCEHHRRHSSFPDASVSVRGCRREECSQPALRHGLVRPEEGAYMRQVRSRRVSPAMVVSCGALTVALGSTGYASVLALIPRDSVGARELKENAGTSAKVRDFSLRAWDFKRGGLPRRLPDRPGQRRPRTPGRGH